MWVYLLRAGTLLGKLFKGLTMETDSTRSFPYKGQALHLLSLVDIRQLTLSKTFCTKRSFTSWGDPWDDPRGDPLDDPVADFKGDFRGDPGALGLGLPMRASLGWRGDGRGDPGVFLTGLNNEDENIPRGGTSGTVSDCWGRFLFKGSFSPAKNINWCLTLKWVIRDSFRAKFCL